MSHYFSVLVVALLISNAAAAYEQTTCEEYLSYVHNINVLQAAVRSLGFFTDLKLITAPSVGNQLALNGIHFSLSAGNERAGKDREKA
jgi:hypothetical protein